MGKVYLVGAGPGDGGLITLKGLEKLKNCDAVVYDRLASEELLEHTGPDCVKIYVGKEAGAHYKKQEEINAILVDSARKYNRVVRLKGGDPFVFGRGGEEIDALTREGIPYELVPGVTSAVAVPELAGIPVTHRGVSRSFHVITGHTKSSVGSPDYDYETLAKLEGTLVFLMGLSNLADIAEHLMQAGKDGNTPVAVISNGTLPIQQTVRGTLLDIGEKVAEEKLPSPAVIVIGETAACEYSFREPEFCDGQPEEQKNIRVGICATDLLWRKLKRELRKRNMQPVSLCDMQVVEKSGMEDLQEALGEIEGFRWVLFTSQNGVRIFFEQLKKQEIDLRRLGQLRFAVLGSGTAERLLSYGVKADFVPSQYTVKVLAEEFAALVQAGERVLIPRAVQGSRELTEILTKHGISYRDIPIYDVQGRLTGNIRYLSSMDYLVFVSASGVTAFFEALRREGLQVFPRTKIACIGEITRKRLLEEYGEADLVASVNDVNGLLTALTEQVRR
jgi:uroporphyrinogen III methyltransferase/synthase